MNVFPLLSYQEHLLENALMCIEEILSQYALKWAPPTLHVCTLIISFPRVALVVKLFQKALQKHCHTRIQAWWKDGCAPQDVGGCSYLGRVGLIYWASMFAMGEISKGRLCIGRVGPPVKEWRCSKVLIIQLVECSTNFFHFNHQWIPGLQLTTLISAGEFSRWCFNVLCHFCGIKYPNDLFK